MGEDVGAAVLDRVLLLVLLPIVLFLFRVLLFLLQSAACAGLACIAY